MSHKIGVIGGDGIGPEVIAEALKVVQAAGVELDTVDYDLGGARYLRDGTILPDSVLDEWRGLDALLLGAVGTPDVAPGVIERGLLLKMRFDLDLYINQRPFLDTSRNVDMVVIRENTEGPYVGEGGVLRRGTPHEVATQGSVNTRLGVERCVRYAFGLAEGRSRKHLTLVHKTNVLTFAGDLWQRAFDEVAGEHPDVGTAYNHVDAACIYFVQDPGRYDVVVTDNLFGDILTDLGGAISGGIGLAASGNLNPASIDTAGASSNVSQVGETDTAGASSNVSQVGETDTAGASSNVSQVGTTGPSMFEPVHGSAPDIAGTGTANPLAAILSAAMMLDFLGEADAAARIRKASYDTTDLKGSTAELGDAVAARL